MRLSFPSEILKASISVDKYCDNSEVKFGVFLLSFSFYSSDLC